MKKEFIIGLGMVSLLLMSCGGEETTEETTNETTEELVETKVEYTIDVENTVINWVGYELDEAEGVHQGGTVKASSGNITMDGEMIVSAGMDVDMNSILAPEAGERLEGHLKNEEFFDVENFASSSFTFDRHEEGIIYGVISVVGMNMFVEAPADIVTDENGVTINISEFRMDMSQIPFFIADLENPIEEQHNPSIGFTATIVGTK